MKRNHAFFIAFLLSLFIRAQMADKNKHIEIAELIKKEYNAKNYKALYNLLNSDFQKQVSEKEMSDFYKFNVYDFYGDIESMTYLDVKDNSHRILAQCKKGQLALNLAVNTEGKIAGMQWLPYAEQPKMPKSLRNDNYASDNPKLSVWDLKVDSLVKDFMSNANNCGLSIGIYENGKTSFYNYGEVKRDSKVLPTNKSIYEIGSVSKVFTGILFARAVADKKVDKNDDIRKYLDGDYKNLEYQGKSIQLVHLSNHTSRIPRIPTDIFRQPGFDQLNPYKHYTRDMVMANLKTLVIDTVPGTKSEYSNYGMALLAIILEKVYGKTYEELVAEYIAKPYVMLSTKINLTDEEKARFMEGYNDQGQKTPHWELPVLAGAGALRSTTEDMLKFIKANIEESNDAIKLSHTTTFNDGRNTTGMAWQSLITKKGNEMIWHNGGTFGASSFCAFIKSKKAGVIVIANSGNRVDQIGLGIMKLLQ